MVAMWCLSTDMPLTGNRTNRKRLPTSGYVRGFCQWQASHYWHALAEQFRIQDTGIFHAQGTQKEPTTTRLMGK
jgi:hypothetical protein